MAEDQGQGSGNDQDDADQNLDDDKDQNQVDDGDDEGGQDDDKSTTVNKSDYDQLFKRMQAADRAKAAAEAKVKEHEQAQMGELDRAKAQLDEETSRADAAEEALKAMRIENEFHRLNKNSWHDVSDVLAAIDLSKVEIGDDGKITGMAEAIKDVAKRKPHFLKSKAEDGEDGEGTGPPAANGANNGRRKGHQGQPDVKALVARFPALGK